MKLSDYIVEFLVRKGVNHFFGYQGTMIAYVVDSIERNPNAINHSCYNEQGASFAACGYAQTKSACACAYATSGPGAVNLLSGVANAYFDSLPIIFFTGQLNTYEYSGIEGLRQQGFQEIDIVSMAKPVTKYVVQITSTTDIVEELNKAYYIANTGRKGPVLIDLPMNIQRGEVENPVYDMDPSTFINSAEADIRTQNIQIQECVTFIADALNHSERPVIMLGNGVDSPESREKLHGFASRHCIPIITSVLAKSTLASDDPLNFGCIGGAYGHRYANMIANVKSDLLICFGISLCTRQIGVKVHEFAKNAKIIRIDIDPSVLLRNIHPDSTNEFKFCINTFDVISNLFENASVEKTFKNWLSVCTRIKTALEYVDASTPERYVNRLIETISNSLQDVSSIAIDVGQHMVWSYQSFKNVQGQNLLFSGGHGAMGYALPAAIGAYYATGKPVACICGDGAFQMNIQELQWVFRENIPISIYIMNNSELGMIRHLQKDYFNNLYAGTSKSGGFTSCSFAKVANAYGITAMSVNSNVSIAELASFSNSASPKLMEIMLDAGTYAYPKTCLGEPIHNQQPYIPKDTYNELMQL